MGEMADYYREGEMFDGVIERDPDEITREHIWTTATGERIAIKDLKDSHLLNIIRCFRGISLLGTKVAPRDPEGRMRWVNALANEAYRRGLKLDDAVEEEPVHE